MTLPTDPKARKAIPLSAVLDYFPDALCALAQLIVAGQKQHGTLGWDRSKSSDHADCLLRHFMERGMVDTDGVRHSTKVVIRALMALQLEIEQVEGLPISRGSLAGVEKIGPPVIYYKAGKAAPEQLELPFGDTCGHERPCNCSGKYVALTSVPEHQTNKPKKTKKAEPYKAPRSRRHK